ncbi:hypothetical protein AB1Y20_005623 [Prymnesium parvum]|uniref:Cyclin-like domain-containing protein n=1 Tax=Prymnesium parvum TaxID=97485 RepID=A0AB34J6R0_PRYPA
MASPLIGQSDDREDLLLDTYNVPCFQCLSEARFALNGSRRELTPDAALQFVGTIAHALELDADCIVHALILLEQLGLELLSILLADDLWRHTVIVAFVLAAKVTIDGATWIEDVREVMLHFGYKLGPIHQQEVQFLKFIDHRAWVTPETYAAYLLPMKAIRLTKEAHALAQRVETFHPLLFPAPEWHNLD